MFTSFFHRPPPPRPSPIPHPIPQVSAAWMRSGLLEGPPALWARDSMRSRGLLRTTSSWFSEMDEDEIESEPSWIATVRREDPPDPQSAVAEDEQNILGDGAFFFCIQLPSDPLRAAAQA